MTDPERATQSGFRVDELRGDGAPPMPRFAQLYATVRDMGSSDFAVARVAFTDPVGERMTMDFTPDVALDLAVQLLMFVKQVGVRGGGD